MQDSALLEQFVRDRDERAFATLVERHVDLVYSAGLRHTQGDHHAAKDVAQQVFVDLARKAPTLVGHPSLAGWLYRSARFTALDHLRRSQRRLSRERAAETMPPPAESPPPDWERVRPVLDDALDELDDADRQSILLRFFGRQNFAAIGRQLGLTENAAQKRVDRALDRLHAALAKRGITSTATALAGALAHAGTAAPASLAAGATTAALAGLASTSLLSMTPIKLLLTGAAAAALGFAGGEWHRTQTAHRALAEAQIASNQRVAALESRLAAEAKRSAAAEADASSLLAAIEQSRKAAATAAQAVVRPAAPAAPNAANYVLSPGDTFVSIGRRFGVEPAVLRAYNPNVDPARLRVGQTLVLPPGAVDSGVATSGPARAAALGDAGYTIAPADTVDSIAQQHGLTRERLQELNPETNWARLRIGQIVRIK